MEQEKAVYSPVSIWKDFDDTSLPLDIEVVSERESENLVFTYLFFNGRVVKDGTSRIYTLLVRKKNKKDLPALVIVSELGKGIDIDEAVFWAKKGYAVIAPDNMGESDNGEKFSIYPKSIKYANFVFSGAHLTRCETNAKQTSWYEWAVNVRRAVTFALSCDCIDHESIGLLGFRDAAVTACMAAAFDDRLSACAVMFGACYQDIEIKMSETNIDATEDAEERERWFAGIAPQSYLMHMKTPFYLCVGSNSYTTDLDKTFNAVVSIPKETPSVMCIEPRLLDAGSEGNIRNLDKWLTLKLKKQLDTALLPVVNFTVMNGKLNAIVRVPDEEIVSEVKIFLARETVSNSSRNWEGSSLINIADGVYRAEADVFERDCSCFAFCNVKFKGGLVLSGNIIKASAEELTDVELSHKTKKLYNGNMGMAEFTVYDPYQCNDRKFLETHPLSVKTGPYDIKGISGKAIATFALNDTKYLKNEDSVLTIDVFSIAEQDIRISFVKDYGADEQKIYNITIKLLGGQLWQKICFGLNELKGDMGNRPKSWDVCEVISFVAENEIVLNNLILT